MTHKEELISEALAVLLNNIYDNKHEISTLLKEALDRKSIADLKKLLD